MLDLVSLKKQRDYGMQSDKNKKYDEFFIHQMANVFGDTMELIETENKSSFHGWFFIKFLYRPTKVYILIESEYGLFTVRLEEEDGSFSFLKRIKSFDNQVSVKNIENAICILKETIDRPITFYKATPNALFRKEGNAFIQLSWDEIKSLRGPEDGSLSKDEKPN